MMEQWLEIREQSDVIGRKCQGQQINNADV